VPTDSNIYEYTLTWIEAVDFDQNGKLSIDEFYESILLLEDFYMSDNEFKYMFNLFDGPEGSGELSVSELAKGVKLLCNKENISDAGLVLKYSV
jgi:Ca2+-binding EF-hand superfamily protein